MKKKRVCILDYGSGNVGSVTQLFRSICDEVIVSHEATQIERATHLILPGVGAFGTTMEKIKNTLPLALLEKVVMQDKKPFLGICVGMQVLATTGIEFGEHQGLNWIKGTVQELKSDYPLPHVGWNDIAFNEAQPLFEGLGRHKDFYFVHKFVFIPEDRSMMVATTEYGEPFCSVIRSENIVGVQFHPEKSQQAGRKLAYNFLVYT